MTEPVQRGLYWFWENRYWYNKPVNVGDTVKYVSRDSSTYSYNETDVVIGINRGTYNYEYVNGQRDYQPVYWQSIRLKHGGSNWRSMKNWRKEENMNNTLALESNDPCFVQEITETIEDGKSVIKNVGDPIRMVNLSTARTYTSNEITTSIREENKYRQFEIYQRKHIARAKKPEIEFA